MILLLFMIASSTPTQNGYEPFPLPQHLESPQIVVPDSKKKEIKPKHKESEFMFKVEPPFLKVR